MLPDWQTEDMSFRRKAEFEFARVVRHVDLLNKWQRVLFVRVFQRDWSFELLKQCEG